MARSSYNDPLKLFRYRIVIDGFARAGFSEASGLEANTDEASYREGGANETEQKSAGLTKFNDISLKRGQIIGSTLGGDFDMQTWYNLVKSQAAQGTAPTYRKDITIQQFDSTNTLVKTWYIYECWPKRYKPFGDLNGTSSENSIEELTLTHEGFDSKP